MIKFENSKLLAIGILVLLLVAIVPTTATAAPLREQIYMLNDCFAMEWNSSVNDFVPVTSATCTVGEVMGKVALSDISKKTNTFKMSYSLKNLEPGAEYVTALVPTEDGVTTTYTYPNQFVSGSFFADDRGTFKLVISTAAWKRNEYEDKLNNGYFFGVIRCYPS